MGINFSIDNNTFIFETVDDYSKAISLLDSIGENRYEEFENWANFNSMRKKYLDENKELPIDALLLLVLLNPDSSLIIENHLFKLDFTTQTIDVKDLDSYSFKSIQSFSFEESVIALVFDQDKLKSTGSTLTTWCSPNPYSYTMTSASGNTTFTCESKYVTAGIYFTLYSKISQSPILSGFLIGLSSGIYASPSTLNAYKNKNGCNNMNFYVHETYGASLTYSAYPASINRLDAYYLYSSFWAWDETAIPNETLSINIYISCDKDELDCL